MTAPVRSPLSPARQTVLRTLAAGGQRALVLADVIPLLVKEGAELGALVDDLPPPEWFDRLARAIELGVFDHPTDRTVRNVVDRILAPPLPAHLENEIV